MPYKNFVQNQQFCARNILILGYESFSVKVLENVSSLCIAFLFLLNLLGVRNKGYHHFLPLNSLDSIAFKYLNQYSKGRG